MPSRPPPIESPDFSALEARIVSTCAAPGQGTTTGRTPAAFPPDLHKVRAASLFGVPWANVTEAQREYAKRMNFAAWYTP